MERVSRTRNAILADKNTRMRAIKTLRTLVGDKEDSLYNMHIIQHNTQDILGLSPLDYDASLVQKAYMRETGLIMSEACSSVSECAHARDQFIRKYDQSRTTVGGRRTLKHKRRIRKLKR